MEDFDRPLAEPGRRAAAEIGQAMRRAGLSPNVILVSPALRTRQTLETAGPWTEPPAIDPRPVLYLATSNQILGLLRELPETVRSTLVIGHNPGLHDLALALAGATSSRPELERLAHDLPTAGLTEFLVTTPWRKLAPGAAALQRFLQPADLNPA